MNINQAKDKVQREVLNAWWKTGRKGTAECATAFGKTRVGVMAAGYMASQCDYTCKILIITPTTAIQDEWRGEFKKWGETKTLKECVQIECINTARTFINEQYSLVIADEIHNYILGDINSAFFRNNTYTSILGLSATIEDNLMERLNTIAPICYSLDLYQAVELGLVSDFTIYNLKVKLSKTERAEYDRLSGIISFTWEKYSRQSWGNISKRKNILYSAKAKMKALEKIINIFDKDSHGIIFSMTKDHSNEVKKVFKDKCLAHHSGITKKTRINNLNKFADGRSKIKLLSSAKTLDEGVTLPRLEYGVIMSNSSKSKQQNQRAGRCIRLGKKGKHAVIVRLYCEDTQEEKWLETSQSKLKVITVNSIAELKKLITKTK